MANNYLEFSETLGALRAEEETWLREQLEIVHISGDREYADDDVPTDLNEAEDWSGCRAWRDLPEYDPAEEAPVGFEYEFLGDDAPDGEGRYLWVHVEECGYPDRVAHLMQKFLRKFHPDRCWTLSYATTCSKPRAGEFGGGCVFVTAAKVEWCSTGDFLEAHSKAFEDAGAQGPEDQTEAVTDKKDFCRAYDLAIDGPTFRRQRHLLINLAGTARRERLALLTAVDAELLEGLVNLTDAIADQAADRHGIDCLPPVSEETGTGDAEERAQPQDRLVRLDADLGLMDEDLDETVHDVASGIASDINNGGVSSQIESLVAQLGEKETHKALRLLADRKGGTS